jgi:hypothetical protein
MVVNGQVTFLSNESNIGGTSSSWSVSSLRNATMEHLAQDYLVAIHETSEID